MSFLVGSLISKIIDKETSIEVISTPTDTHAHTHTDIIAHSPAGRLLESEEVAECVLRVCEMGVVMKGQEVVVDGVTDPLAGI